MPQDPHSTTLLHRLASGFYRLARAADRAGLRGGWRLSEMVATRGLLVPTKFRLSPDFSIVVPLDRNRYDDHELAEYENLFVRALVDPVRKFGAPFTLVDGGADIGLFSMKLFIACPSISRIVAFEPNPEGIPWTRTNLARLPIPATANCLALADFEGFGTLEAPVPGMHTAQFLRPDPKGPIAVTTIDLHLPEFAGNLLLKLDVEGGELAALRGARNTIAKATNAIVAIEAHPAVRDRCGIEPLECLKLLTEIRPFHFFVAETGTELTLDRPVFEQIEPSQVYNVIGVSR